MIEMMKAAIFVEPGKMTVEEVPKATLRQDDDIVIRVVRTCVCGSDLWFFRGLSGQAAHSQVGHESIGVVEEVGAAVESVKPGDFVVVPFPYSCGKCPVCKAGFESVCPHGGYFSACQAEYLRVPERAKSTPVACSPTNTTSTTSKTPTRPWASARSSRR